MKQQLGSKLANSVRQAQSTQASDGEESKIVAPTATTKIVKPTKTTKPAAKVSADTPAPKLPSSRRVWPD